MANQPPAYPNELTKDYWDKKKGLLAKVAGKTGVGEAAETAKDAYDQIDWKVFDNATLPALGAARQDPQHFAKQEGLIKAEYAKHVEPTRKALLTLSSTAKTAADSLTKKSLKDAAKVASDISSKAINFATGLKDNGVYFSEVAKDLAKEKASHEKVTALLRKNAADTSQFLKELVKGLMEVRNDPSTQAWDVKVKQQGRSVSNGLKLMQSKHLTVWTSKFKGFDWATLDFDKVKGEELKTKVNAFATEVFTEAKILGPELK